MTKTDDLGSRYDFHSHTFLSDGELGPAELVRRAQVLGIAGIAITDHCDYTNVEFLIKNLLKNSEQVREGIDVYVGVELTHVPPAKIDALAKKAKSLGAQIVVVHGETPVEPVEEGTNKAAVSSAFVDVLAHPGYILKEDVELAKEGNVFLELTTRRGHCQGNEHVAKLADKVGTNLVVNTDTHAPEDLINQKQAFEVALAAGLDERQARKAIKENPLSLIQRLK
ncbi:MAG: histidinol phosphate phosphatase domain-containing protein [Candidatus Altiarchaeota archaeon]